jgi:DNA-binding CsgD family transcriptional regulator
LELCLSYEIRENDMTVDNRLDYLVEVLYESILDNSRWNEAMELCARYAGGIAAVMFTLDKHLNTPVFSVQGGEITNPENASEYLNHYMSIDPRMTRMMSGSGVGVWQNCHTYFDKQFVNRNEFYQDFLIPNGGRYTLAAWVDDGPGQHTAIGLQRSADQLQFGEAELMAAQRFSGHLQRALRLQSHTQQLQAKAEMGARAIDALALAMFIVDDTAAILHLNSVAECLLHNSDSGLICRSGRLSAHHSLNKTQLMALISAASTGFPATGGAMFLRGQTKFQLFVMPLPAASPFSKDWQKPLVLILVLEAGMNPSSFQLMGQLYGLTTAELRVASALLAGKTPEEYRLEAGVSMSTVRSQLKSLYRKTDTRRQSELVSLLCQAPPIKS